MSANMSKYSSGASRGVCADWGASSKKRGEEVLWDLGWLVNKVGEELISWCLRSPLPDDLLSPGSVHLRGVDASGLPGDLQVLVEVVAIEVLPVQGALAPVVLLGVPEAVVGVEPSVGWKVRGMTEAQVPLSWEQDYQDEKDDREQDDQVI